MKAGLLGEVDLLDISKIEELRNIEVKENGIYIGALCTLTQLSENTDIRAGLPCLADAALVVGAVQIRNKATIGGNIMNASPAADTVPALVALGAMAHLKSAEGTREIQLEDLFLAPGRTLLRDDELLTALYIPKQPLLSAGAFMKLGKRKAQAISVANLAIWIRVDDQKEHFLEARIALGSVAPTVVRIPAAEEFLQEGEINQENLSKAADLVSDGIRPITDIRASESYRRKVSRALCIKALDAALGELGIEI
jgi:carbon-monoxide dehydrogenase medium subunit